MTITAKEAAARTYWRCSTAFLSGSADLRVVDTLKIQARHGGALGKAARGSLEAMRGRVERALSA